MGREDIRRSISYVRQGRDLREHEAGVKTADPCRRHGIGDATLYNWSAKYDAKRLKDLEGENAARLKKRLADAMLDNAFLAKKMVTLAAKREAVAHLRSGL
jgi:putative transposase